MEKQEIIDSIQRIIRKWGPFNTAEVYAESSPIYATVGNSCSLIESFNLDDVEVVTYAHDQQVDSFYVEYNELNEEQLVDLLVLAEEYDADCDKTRKRCED